MDNDKKQNVDEKMMGLKSIFTISIMCMDVVRSVACFLILFNKRKTTKHLLVDMGIMRVNLLSPLDINNFKSVIKAIDL